VEIAHLQSTAQAAEVRSALCGVAKRLGSDVMSVIRADANQQPPADSVRLLAAVARDHGAAALVPNDTTDQAAAAVVVLRWALRTGVAKLASAAVAARAELLAAVLAPPVDTATVEAATVGLWATVLQVRVCDQIHIKPTRLMSVCMWVSSDFRKYQLANISLVDFIRQLSVPPPRRSQRTMAPILSVGQLRELHAASEKGGVTADEDTWDDVRWAAVLLEHSPLDTQQKGNNTAWLTPLLQVCPRYS